MVLFEGSIDAAVNYIKCIYLVLIYSVIFISSVLVGGSLLLSYLEKGKNYKMWIGLFFMVVMMFSLFKLLHTFREIWITD